MPECQSKYEWSGTEGEAEGKGQIFPFAKVGDLMCEEPRVWVRNAAKASRSTLSLVLGFLTGIGFGFLLLLPCCPVTILDRSELFHEHDKLLFAKGQSEFLHVKQKQLPCFVKVCTCAFWLIAGQVTQHNK